MLHKHKKKTKIYHSSTNDSAVIQRKIEKKAKSNAVERNLSPTEGSMTDLFRALKNVDPKAKDAELNSKSMDNNNGFRYWYNFLFGFISGKKTDNSDSGKD
jgi:hypothetical protein